MNARLEINGVKAGEVTINGRAYTGRSISIIGDCVVVDGKQQDGPVRHGPVDVIISGNCNTVHIGSGTVESHGKVGSIHSGSGDVFASDVGGNITTGSGEVGCRDVRGSVRTGSGNIAVRKVGGAR